MIWGLGLLALGVGFAYALTRKPLYPTAEPSARSGLEDSPLASRSARDRAPSAEPPAGNQDKQTGLYRVRVFVHPKYQGIIKNMKSEATPQATLTEVLKTKMLQNGFSEILVSLNDPTDTDYWTFIARLPKGSPIGFPSGSPLRIESMELIDEPTVQTDEYLSPLLDAGLTQSEVEAIQHALIYDNDEKHLGGFASTLEPEYPLAACLLYIKAKLALARSYGLGADHSRQSSLQSTIDSACSRNLIQALSDKSASLGPEVSSMWARFIPVVNNMSARHCDALMKKLDEVSVSQEMPPVIPNAAIQLAYATKRPELSLVEDRKKIGQKLKIISKVAGEGNQVALQAQNVVSRAEKLLERRSWVQWFRRIEDAKALGQGPPPGSLTRRHVD